MHSLLLSLFMKLDAETSANHERLANIFISLNFAFPPGGLPEYQDTLFNFRSMALFYTLEPPRSQCDLETVRISMKERLGGHYEASAHDQVAHFLLSVLATTTPYLKTLIRRIERQMFAERLARIGLASLRKHLCGYVDYLQSDSLQVCLFYRQLRGFKQFLA